MHTMIKLTALSLLLGSAATVATARDADFGQLDTNADGYVDRAELEAHFGSDGALAILGRDDTDGDDRLSRDEAIASDENDNDPDEDVEVELDDGDDRDSDDDDDDDDNDDDDDDDDDSDSDDDDNDDDDDDDDDD